MSFNINDIIIKDYNYKDIDVIAQYCVHLALETENRVCNKEIVKQSIQKNYDFKDKLNYKIVKYNSDIIACLMICPGYDIFSNNSFLQIESVYVDKEYRGKGIFKKLYHNIYNQCITDKYYKLMLYVEIDNERAITTYNKLGMKILDNTNIYEIDVVYYKGSMNEASVAEQIENYNKYITFFKEYKGLILKNINNCDNNIINNSIKKSNLLNSNNNCNNIVLQKNIKSGEIILIYINDKKIGILSYFYEYSEWRDGYIIWINYLTIVDEYLNDINLIINGISHSLIKEFSAEKIIKNIRWIVENNSVIKIILQDLEYKTCKYYLMETDNL